MKNVVKKKFKKSSVWKAECDRERWGRERTDGGLLQEGLGVEAGPVRHQQLCNVHLMQQQRQQQQQQRHILSALPHSSVYCLLCVCFFWGFFCLT